MSTNRVCRVFRSRSLWPFGGKWYATVNCADNGKDVSGLKEGYHNKVDCLNAANDYLKFDRMEIEGVNVP